MNNMKKRIQIALAIIGLITALSMCGSGETVDSGVGFQSMIVVMLSGALLLNAKRQSENQE